MQGVAFCMPSSSHHRVRVCRCSFAAGDQQRHDPRHRQDDEHGPDRDGREPDLGTASGRPDEQWQRQGVPCCSSARLRRAKHSSRDGSRRGGAPNRCGFRLRWATPSDEQRRPACNDERRRRRHQPQQGCR
ncbi:hypothetical protein SEVIR_2G442800v4 [Setaria viridis]